MRGGTFALLFILAFVVGLGAGNFLIGIGLAAAIWASVTAINRPSRDVN